MKKTLLGILVLFVCIGFGYYLRGFIPASTKQVETVSPDSRLDSMITLSASQGPLYIVIFKDEVSFGPFESPYKSFSISKKDYPDLFKQGVANSSFISAEVSKDSKTGNSLVVLSNNQPDHGGYSSTYQLIINPLNGEVVKK